MNKTDRTVPSESFKVFLWGFCLRLDVPEDLEIHFQHHNKAVPWSPDPEAAGKNPAPHRNPRTNSSRSEKEPCRVGKKMKDLNGETKAPF